MASTANGLSNMDIEHFPHEIVEISSIELYENNARTHSNVQVRKLTRSIREFGFTNPILIDGNRGLIAGHGRLLAAERIGMTHVPAINVGDISEEKKRALVLADNRLALDSGWDPSILASELKNLDSDYQTLTGFNPDELANLMKKNGDAAKPIVSEIVDSDYGGATSIARTGAPVRFWQEQGKLHGDVLDFGSGQEGHQYAKYDIVHYPDPAVLLRQWDVVMCNYVLNVQPADHLITQILVLLKWLLRDDGLALIAVRSDVKTTGKTSRGFQVGKRADEWTDMIHKIFPNPEVVEQPGFFGFVCKCKPGEVGDGD